jgi:streptogramin lyase
MSERVLRQGKKLYGGLTASAAVAALGLLWVAGASAAPLGAVEEFSESRGLNLGSVPTFIAAGPEGNLWFSDDGSEPAIGRITPSGTITEFAISAHGGNAESQPTAIALGPDGNIWFVDKGATQAIGEIEPGKITATTGIKEFSNGLVGTPFAIAAGPDGNMWFTDIGATHQIGEVTPSGTINEFPAPAGSKPFYIALGADGNMWFTDTGTTPAIGQFNPTTHAFQKPPFTAGLLAGSKPKTIAAGADGNMWFTDTGTTPAIGKINPLTDAIEEFTKGLSSGASLNQMARGPDGNVWFAENPFGGATPKALGRVAPNGAITELSWDLPFESFPEGITAGPDGNIWFTDKGTTPQAIGRMGTGVTVVEGKEGTGVTTKTFAPGLHGCVEGGTEVVSASGTTYVCNGATGSIGPIGPVGVQGEKGPAGANGTNGKAGANGTNGAQGPAGAAGATGPAGKDGQIELVTCKTVVVKKKKKQKCTTKLVSGTVKFTASAARASLSRAGVVYATGRASSVHGRTRLVLRPLRRLSAGRYTLTLASGHGHTAREQLTIR